MIWNLESGYIKATMREPFLELRSKEEKPVEKVKKMCQTYLSLSEVFVYEY